MVKRYYCDYCDASYPYSVEARKKHGQGHFHQKLKKLHYEKFKSSKEKLKYELQREKCKSFHSGRQCLYGNSCIYSHLTATDFENLHYQ
ncbi:Zinc finger matrin-type protein 5, partial [Halocaridina rubra]